MKYLDITFADPASNLACDEALLELAEAEQVDDDILRVWEPARHFIVLGHANSFCSEVKAPACSKNPLPILRRISGGGTVLQGPGCLNYSLLLNSAKHRLRGVADGFHYVLERHQKMIERLIGQEVRREGISDLAISGRKFSGNAQYRKSRAVLVHGTFLLDFDLHLIAQYLQVPKKRPAYRQDRPHADFVTKLSLASPIVRENLKLVWKATEPFAEVPLSRINSLVRDRYGRDQWSEKF